MRYFDEIAKKAQELSEKNGRADCSVLDIWLEAERIVMTRQVEQDRECRKKRVNTKCKCQVLEKIQGLS